MICAEN